MAFCQQWLRNRPEHGYGYDMWYGVSDEAWNMRFHPDVFNALQAAGVLSDEVQVVGEAEDDKDLLRTTVLITVSKANEGDNQKPSNSSQLAAKNQYSLEENNKKLNEAERNLRGQLATDSDVVMVPPPNGEDGEALVPVSRRLRARTIRAQALVTRAVRSLPPLSELNNIYTLEDSEDEEALVLDHHERRRRW